MASTTQILRGTIFHTPGDAFINPDALVSIGDGGLAVSGGKVAMCGDYSVVAEAFPDAEVRDLSGGILLPGFVDTHIHYPQTRIAGALGYTLLDWLDTVAMPEEARMADADYAATIASEFMGALASNGTTTALVFGSHFASATTALFEAAEAAGLRIFSGLVLSDRRVPAALRQTPSAAHRESSELIRRFHGRGRLGYAVIPRFALSTSEKMLEVCESLLRENTGLRFTTHISENLVEIGEVARAFPWAEDYLGVYERFGLLGRSSVLAHNVHAPNKMLTRLATSRTAIAHCPCSNAALGSGIFPMARHLKHWVHFGLGTDVGAGTGFGMMKEALQAYLQQRVATDPLTLTPAQMLYLVTRAGADALGIASETGDFTTGKSADYVYLRPHAHSVLAGF